MTPELRCPSCGQLNDSALEECANCSFPLHLGKSGVAASAELPAPEPAPDPAEVAEVRLYTLADLKTELAVRPGMFTPWFRERARELFGLSAPL